MELLAENIFSVEKCYAAARQTGSDLLTLGSSPQGRPIYALKQGRGGKRVLFIARLHGNEPAPTGAVIEFFRNNTVKDVEIYGIFLANPDSAALYEQLWHKHNEPHWKNSFEKARLNSAGVDLNRDWLNLTQKETRLIHDFISALKPDFVVDHHEFYWKEQFPPRIPVEEQEGFLATITDAPYYLVHPQVKALSEQVMNYIIEKLTERFQWRIKPRHFAGSGDKTYINPEYIGAYLALRGIPKLLVETWGVACSKLLLHERVEFHRQAMENVIAWIAAHHSAPDSRQLPLEEVKFRTDDVPGERIDLLYKVLAKHNIEFEAAGHWVLVKTPSIASGFVKTIYNFIINRKDESL